jgi:hypothetical protein
MQLIKDLERTLLHLSDSETVLFDRIRRVLSDKVASHNEHHLGQIRQALRERPTA